MMYLMRGRLGASLHTTTEKMGATELDQQVHGNWTQFVGISTLVVVVMRCCLVPVKSLLSILILSVC